MTAKSFAAIHATEDFVCLIRGSHKNLWSMCKGALVLQNPEGITMEFEQEHLIFAVQ